MNRVSVGVQSFDDGLLREMDRYERYGSSQEIIEHIEAAAPHFATLNLDLIFNLPHQDLASLECDLDIVRGLKANQVSLQPLMTSKSTALKMARTMGKPAPGRLRSYYETILARLRPSFSPQSGWCFSRGAGTLDQYIVEAEDSVGLGSGAFSYVEGTMSTTTFSIHSYIDRIGRGFTGTTGICPLTAAEQMKQSFLMRMFGLKLDKAWTRERHGARFERELWPTLTAFKLIGAIEEHDASYQLTDRGMYYWVLMMSAFFESMDAFREQMRGRIDADLEDRRDPPTAPRAQARGGPGEGATRS